LELVVDADVAPRVQLDAGVNCVQPVSVGRPAGRDQDVGGLERPLHRPGAHQELENVLERAIILSNGPTLEIDAEVFASATAARAAKAGPPTPAAAEAEGPAAARVVSTPRLESLESNTRNHILAALEASDWVIDGPHGAAKTLGIHPNTLRGRMKKLGIVRVAQEARQ
jgi:transcriptional regulator with GAF, ATPase, and Fis domain